MLNEPETITIKDINYKLEGFTLEIQQLFERFMEGKFLKLIKDNKDKLAEDYLPMLEKHFFDVKHGKYKFNSDNFYLFINADENLLELLHWCVCKHQPILKQDLKEWIESNVELAIKLFERLMNDTKKN